MVDSITWKRGFGALALCLGALAAPSAFAVAVVSVSSAPAPAVAGSTVSVDAKISGIAGLYGYQFSLSFNPAVLQATGVSEGSFLSSGGTTFFSSGTINNTAGTISFMFDTLSGSGTAVSGNGTLTTVSFNVLRAGVSNIAFSDTLFIDSAFADIPVTIQNGTVSAVPEPSAMALLALGLAGMGAGMFVRDRRHNA